MKLARKILLGLLVLLLLTPMSALYMVASTQAGLRFAARHLGRMGAVTITAQNVSGTLTRGFTVGSLRVQQRDVDVRITRAAGQLRLLPLLLQRRIELTHAEAQDVTVQLLEVAGGHASRLHFLPATLGVEADTARAATVNLILRSGRSLHATDASAGVEVLPQVIHITAGQLDWNEMHLAADGRVHATQPVGLDGRVSADWHPADKPAWRFDTSFDGDLAQLPLKLDIGKPFHAHLDGAATLTNDWKIMGEGTTDDLDISVFGGGNALGILSARVALTVDANGFSAQGPVTASGLAAGPIEVNFHGAYANRRLTIRDSTLLHRASGARATLRGTVDVLPGNQRLALAGKWTTLQWPLAGAEPAFTSTQGQFSLDGVKPWKLNATGNITAAGLQDMPASLLGDLDTGSFAIEQATLGLLGGSASVTGEARWHPQQSWSVAGHMSGLDPALLRADLPGRLDFDFHAGGTPFGKAGSIDFALSHLAGKLRGQTASGGGQFTRAASSPDWQFHQVDLQLGHARIQLDGSLGATRDVRFAIDADDLSLFDASARGRLSARGRYAGTVAAPLLLFKARGNDFEWQGYKVDALDADLDVDLQGAGHAQGKVDLAGIQHGARTVQQATLDLSGTGKAQRVSLAVNAAPLRALLTADGAIDNSLWRGNVQSLTVSDDAELALRLEKPASLEFDLTKLDLGNLCLTGNHARGCISGQRHPDGGWSTTFSAQGMPLRAFTAGLSGDMDYDGTIDLHGELAGFPGRLPTGSASAELMQARLRHDPGNGHFETLSLGSGSLQTEATTTGFSAQVALDAGASGSIKGQLTGQRNNGDWRDYPVQGRLEARTDGLSLLDMYVGGIDKATGQLNTSVDIGGTLGDPTLAGQLQLRDASIDVYQVNLALRELSLDARFDTHALDLSGQSRLGDGTAHFNGKLSWREDEPYGNLHMDGRNLRVVDVPEARIEASPNLDFKLAGHRIEASGEVLIPKAKLEPADLTNTVLVSSDEVLVGAPPVDAQNRWTVISDIKLVLGDDINIKALGLTARLGGGIEVRTDESQTSRGNGALTIKSGQYKAYGRLLDIERGSLIYKNVALDDPAVDLRAQKVFPEVTAHINLRGPLRSPQVTFSSEPELPQSQIVSLLLAGGSLESVQNSQQPGAARNEMLAQGVGILAQRVGSRVGIDDVGIESDMGNDTTSNISTGTSLVLGKYLSPRLYISYGISLAEAINTFKMRWTIARGWTLKTEAGQARSADIVYTIQKGSKEKKKADPAAKP